MLNGIVTGQSLDAAQIVDLILKGGGLVAVVYMLARVMLGIIAGQKGTTDNQKAVIDLNVKLSQIIADQQLSMSKRDQQIDLIQQAMDRYTISSDLSHTLLNQLRVETGKSGDRTQMLHDAFVQGINDTGTAINTMSQYLEQQIGASTSTIEANIVAKVDGLPERVALRMVEPHKEIKTMIVERTKSIEDLFGKLVQENRDLAELNRLKDDTIKALNQRLTDCLNPPPPPDPDHKAPIPATPETIVTLPTNDDLEAAA